MKSQRIRSAVLPVAVALFSANIQPLLAAEELRPSAGTYKDALRKAGQEGKLVMLAFYNDSYIDCKRLHAHLAEIPEASTKFICYIVKGERGDAVVREHHVSVFPTLVFLKPDGTEVTRQQGIDPSAIRQKYYLDSVLDKAGPIPIAQKPKQLSPTEKAAAEAAAKNELRSAILKLNVGRKKDAIKELQQVASKYPAPPPPSRRRRNCKNWTRAIRDSECLPEAAFQDAC